VCSLAMAANTRRRDVTKTAFSGSGSRPGSLGAKIAQHETTPNLAMRGSNE